MWSRSSWEIRRFRVNYADFEMIAGVEEPLVAYARKDTPPGPRGRGPTSCRHTNSRRSRSTRKNSNTINQALSLDLLGLKIPGDPPPIAASKRSKQRSCRTRDNWRIPRCRAGPASVEPTMGKHRSGRCGKLAPRGKDGSYPRSPALPGLPTFRGILRDGERRPAAVGIYLRSAARVERPDGRDVPHRVDCRRKTPSEPVALMRSAFVELWKNPEFIRDYAKRHQDQAHLRDWRRGAGHPGRGWPRSSPRSRPSFSTTATASSGDGHRLAGRRAAGTLKGIIQDVTASDPADKADARNGVFICGGIVPCTMSST